MTTQATISDGLEELFVDLPSVLTVEDIAQTVRVSPSTVLRWHHEEGLDAIKIGTKTLRFPKEQVVAFCTTHC